MSDLPATRPSLLLRLRDPRDTAAWRQCVEVYGPAVYGYARRRGLQDADAGDVTQDVLRSVLQAIGGLDYDPAAGSFRGWLFTLVRRRLADHRDRAGRQCAGTGDSAVLAALRDLPGPDADAGAWDEEWERARFAWAADRVRGRMAADAWQAFWQTAVDGVRPADVADRLGMPVARVYLARSRVMARLREELQGLDPD